MAGGGSAPSGGIEVRGASVHNLKSLDITIERGALTVITGVSGSGKSSLAFDTIFAEAQRRFLHTLSHYARQFLEQAQKPNVKQINGLSPAIAMAQTETNPSPRASVGTQTDLGELVAVLFARFGDTRCPTHDRPTAAMDLEAMVEHLLASGKAAAASVVILAPLATAKKGTFRATLAAAADRGYLRALVNGQVVELDGAPDLDKSSKHTIKLIIDQLPLKESSRARLSRALAAALHEGGGIVEWAPAAAVLSGSVHDEATVGRFSSQGGCPDCGFSWPKLDTRHFAANSLGRCASCDGRGVAGGSQDDGETDEEADESPVGEGASDDWSFADPPCAECGGTGLAGVLRAIRVGGLSPQAVHSLSLSELMDYLRGLQVAAGPQPARDRVVSEALAIASRIDGIGLGYLSLGRRLRTLSGGELQRLKLASVLSESLSGVLYVLDEPSQGLHPQEVAGLTLALKRLLAAGNTVIAVDHDEQLMLAADWIVDLGPGGGARGGRVLAQFRPGDAGRHAASSPTARRLAALSGQSRESVPGPPRETISGASNAIGAPWSMMTIRDVTLNNLKNVTAQLPLAALTVVTGVSGAGKTSLVAGALMPLLGQHVARRPTSSLIGALGKLVVPSAAAIESVQLVSRRSLARSGVAMPASYLGVLTELRDLFAAQPEAQVLGLTKRAFSLSVEGGRCKDCRGRGEIVLKMRFLADARVPCQLCAGKRFQSAVLGVRYLGMSMSDALNLTIADASEVFRNHRRIAAALAPAVDLGLGYLSLGQPLATLSGGEAQRLRLVPALSRRVGGTLVLALDEPTDGLHFEDVDRLVTVLRRLVAAGTTVIAIEHHPALVAAADWLIEIGPGAAQAGGKVVSQGPRPSAAP